MAYVRLERTCRHDNTLKFYEIEVTRDVLDDWVTERRWGRIGHEGGSARNGFRLEAEAVENARSFCREKLGRGYHVVADPDGLVPTDAVSAEDWHARMLRAADELDRLGAALPMRDSRFGRIVESLASACRQRRQAAQPPVLESQQAAWALDDTDYRIRARIFQLLDELVSGVMDDDGVAATVRHIQDAANPGLAGASVRFVPRTRHAALNHRLENFMAGDPALASVCEAMRQRGMAYVGDLVQAPFTEVLRCTRGDRRLLARLEERLKALGVQLGSQAPRWHAPQERRVSGLA